MKTLSRDPSSRARALKAEARANEASGGGVKGITIKPISGSAKGGGFKKGGFKNAFGPAEDEDRGGKQNVNEEAEEEKEEVKGVEAKRVVLEDDSETDEDAYDPRKPTGCGPSCKGR